MIFVLNKDDICMKYVKYLVKMPRLVCSTGWGGSIPDRPLLVGGGSCFCYDDDDDVDHKDGDHDDEEEKKEDWMTSYLIFVIFFTRTHFKS